MVKFSSLKGNYQKKMQDHIINERIRATNLIVIDGSENLGLMSRDDALRYARSKEKDLVLIASNAAVPVAKVLEYNKFLYEEKKKKAAVKAKSKKSELKELRLSATIGEGDLTKRAERAVGFIKDGNRVKISILLQGREAAYPDIAMEKIRRFSTELEGIAKPESDPKIQGKLITVIYLAK